PRQIRDDPEGAKAALARRGLDAEAVDGVLEADARRRELLPELEQLRAEKNTASKRIGELQREGRDATEAIAEVRAVGEREKSLETDIAAAEKERDELLLALPNLPDPSALAEDELPLRYAGFSTCFRREAGAAGKDTRGIFRVHQFDKVEMFTFVVPEEAQAEHERLLAIEEELLQALEIPYRVVNIAVDDLGASAAKKYDCEAWLPSQGRYRELTSTSNTTDFQSRRLDIRFRADGGRPAHVHTL